MIIRINIDQLHDPIGRRARGCVGGLVLECRRRIQVGVIRLTESVPLVSRWRLRQKRPFYIREAQIVVDEATSSEVPLQGFVVLFTAYGFSNLLAHYRR